MKQTNRQANKNKTQTMTTKKDMQHNTRSFEEFLKTQTFYIILKSKSGQAPKNILNNDHTLSLKYSVVYKVLLIFFPQRIKSNISKTYRKNMN